VGVMAKRMTRLDQITQDVISGNFADADPVSAPQAPPPTNRPRLILLAVFAVVGGLVGWGIGQRNVEAPVARAEPLLVCAHLSWHGDQPVLTTWYGGYTIGQDVKRVGYQADNVERAAWMAMTTAERVQYMKQYCGG
jgi:hypothetical protein